ncbi:DMT family transporter [Desemzia sp. FAM 23991]|uniref:DMT family transporter n=1 Tax=unclassified Desemzia TaxID=2685243 RepID=UPI003886243B
MKKAKYNVMTAMFIFGSMGLFVKRIQLSSSEIALSRGLLGCLFIGIVLVVKREKISWRLVKKNSLALLFSGGAIGVNWLLLFESYRYTTISNATLSYYFAPVFVVLVSAVLLKEKLTVKKVSCIGIAMSGMFMIVNSGGISSVGNSDPLKGIAFGLAAAVFYAGMMISNKFLKGFSGLQSTFFQLLIATGILIPYVFFTEGFDLLRMPIASLPYLVILGIVHTGITYVMFFSSIPYLKGQTTAMLSYIDPVSAILFSTIFLNEHLSLVQFIGGVFVLGAAFISEWQGIPKSKPTMG